MLARYTPTEARVLEDHYIRCAKAEGIWGMGKPPLSASDKARSREAGTAAGLVRQARARERKRQVLQAVRSGYSTSAVICAYLKLSDTCVRRYLRELQEMGYIEIESVCAMGGKTWTPVDGKTYRP